MGSLNMMTGVQFPSRAYGEEFDGKGKTHFDDFYVSRLSVVGIPDFQQKKKDNANVVSIIKEHKSIQLKSQKSIWCVIFCTIIK